MPNNIPQWKRDRCGWCARGWEYAIAIRRLGSKRIHTDDHDGIELCTAPTEGEYIAELQERLKESAEDVERLNWMEQNARKIAYSTGYRGEKDGWIYRSGDGNFSNDASSLRAAIDAARKQESTNAE